MTITSPFFSLACPVPDDRTDRIQLAHGAGGALTAELVTRCFMPHLCNESLAAAADAAVLDQLSGDLVISTDGFVVKPLEFPGGNIGSLAVHGTLNDLAMMGARPVALTAGFVLEEGLDLEVVDRIAEAMGAAARRAGVPIVAADTKVVERGKGDGVYINTTGIGTRSGPFVPGPGRIVPGDAVIVSAPVGSHGVAILSARGGLDFEADVVSDTASLAPLVELLRPFGADVHALRDPTRGGLATALNELAMASQVGMVLEEAAVPILPPVAAACAMLGLDPLYLANEGVLVALVPADRADSVLDALRSHPLGEAAARIGRVHSADPGRVLLRTALGSRRLLVPLRGDPLPRIC